jgi:hypothetical protein
MAPEDLTPSVPIGETEARQMVVWRDADCIGVGGAGRYRILL